MYQIIGSKNRLQILKLLSRRDHYVSEIMQQAKMDGKNAKHHLDTLQKADIITSYQQGRKKYYHLTREINLQITPPPEGRFILTTTKKTPKNTHQPSPI